ncbi:biopolymer transporter ExbD [bacterium]|nr:biopolymer transporter ExbD [bacterium]
MARRLKKTRLSKAELTLTPMIDTALTLLIIFMITAPMMRNAIKVTLPDGSAKEAGNIKQ